jgi:hypothetical protein
MVNIRFRQRIGLWFRNGGRGARAHSLAKSRHQSKIYTDSNQSDFLQISGGLTSTQTLAIYRRLVIKDRLRDQPNTRA